MILVLSMKLRSASNLNEHWRARHRRTVAQRSMITLAMKAHAEHRGLLEYMRGGGRLWVTMIRVSPRFLDDDNLAGAFKAVRDGIAKELGVSDAPGGPVEWRYDQRKPLTPKATPGVMVMFGRAAA